MKQRTVKYDLKNTENHPGSRIELFANHSLVVIDLSRTKKSLKIHRKYYFLPTPTVSCLFFPVIERHINHTKAGLEAKTP